jgi:hypothetical protein
MARRKLLKISGSSSYSPYNVISSFASRVNNLIDIVVLINKDNLARNLYTLIAITIFIYLTNFPR